MTDTAKPLHDPTILFPAEVEAVAARKPAAGGSMMNRTIIDETGHRYGRLTVLRKHPVAPDRKGALWVCQCDCGGTKTILGTQLRTGRYKSCGQDRRDSSRPYAIGTPAKATSQNRDKVSPLGRTPLA